MPAQEPASPAPADEEKAFDPNDPANWVALDYVESVIQDRLERQSEAWDLLDGRLRLILGVVGIIFAAVLGFQRGASQLEHHVALLVNAAVVLFLLAGLIAGVAYWPGDFNWPPDPDEFRRWITTDPRKVKFYLVDTLVIRGYNQNKVLMLWKGRAFRASYVLTIVAIMALAGALMNHMMAQSKEARCDTWVQILQPVCMGLDDAQHQFGPQPAVPEETN